MLRSSPYITVCDDNLTSTELINKYRSELDSLCTFDKDTQDTFGHVNTWWVFSEVASKLSCDVFMAEAENIGYKRYKKNKSITDKPMPNELFRVSPDGKILIDDDENSTILDCIRQVQWQ